MLDFKTYHEINIKAIKSIRSDSDDEPISDTFNILIFYALFYFFPLVLSSVTFIYNVKISSFDKVLASGIAIFTGLFFSLLINISSRIRIEKQNPNIDHDAFNRYKNNMKQIANIILYTVSLGIYIIFFILINHLLKDASEYIEKIITALVFFIVFKYFISILFMIQRFRFIIRDEIENIL